MKDLITNITGAALAVVTILLVFNVVTNDQATTLVAQLPIIIAATGSAVGSIVSIFFAKDKK